MFIPRYGYSKVLGAFNFFSLMFMYGVIGDNFLFLSVSDSDEFAFVWIKLHQPVSFPCLHFVYVFLHCIWTCVVLMLRYRRQSSAKSLTVEETWFGRSFM